METNANNRKIRQKITDQNRKLQVKMYKYNYYKEHPCIDCGETDPVVLQFDHLKEKSINVSKIKMSLDSLKKEIEKCEVVCANCHARRTAKQAGWYDFGIDVSSYKGSGK